LNTSQISNGADDITTKLICQDAISRARPLELAFPTTAMARERRFLPGILRFSG
jgi:hypothetical protein